MLPPEDFVDKLVSLHIPFQLPNSLKKGAFLYNHGYPANEIYVILDTARIDCFSILPDGKEVHSYTYDQNHYLAGVHLLHNGSISSVSGQVHRTGLAVKVHRKDLENTDDPEIHTSLLELSLSLHHQMQQRLVWSHLNVEQRVAHYLLSREEEIIYNVTHSYLSRILGVTRPPISSTMKILRTRGFIDSPTYKTIHVLDKEGLRDIAYGEG